MHSLSVKESALCAQSVNVVHFSLVHFRRSSGRILKQFEAISELWYENIILI